ncbi:MAG TPA: hypothetical protein PLR06_10920, partial [Cyclobacteriaceae bacterium]|nr:hypothetical protein [Cyclobacteriaceae bacterium]
PRGPCPRVTHEENAEMRQNRTRGVAVLVLAAATAPAQAIDFTFLTHESLVGVLSVDGLFGFECV